MKKIDDVGRNFQGEKMKTGLTLEVKRDLPAGEQISAKKFECNGSELVKQTMHLAQDHGYEVRILNLKEPTVSASCNFPQ